MGALGQEGGDPVMPDLLQPRQLALITALLATTRAPVQVGGGVRSEQDVADLLAAGANRVVVGSTAVKSPDLVASWMEKYGPERIVLALDVNIDAQGNRVYTDQPRGNAKRVPLATSNRMPANPTGAAPIATAAVPIMA